MLSRLATAVAFVVAAASLLVAPGSSAQTPAVTDFATPAGVLEPADRQRPAPRRVVIISDSAMAGVRWQGALGGLRGFDADHRLESCRRLYVQDSCRGREGYRPPTAFVELRDHVAPAGPRDVLVISVGYNDWHVNFSTDARAILQMAATKGFETVAWVTYRDDVSYTLPDDGDIEVSNYAAMNRHLDALVESNQYPALELWDLDGYSASAPGWFAADGVHETRLGAWGVADWISRHVAHLDALPCPVSWVPDAPLDQECPDPDEAVLRRGVPAIAQLYSL